MYKPLHLVLLAFYRFLDTISQKKAAHELINTWNSPCMQWVSLATLMITSTAKVIKKNSINVQILWIKDIMWSLQQINFQDKTYIQYNINLYIVSFHTILVKEKYSSEHFFIEDQGRFFMFSSLFSNIVWCLWLQLYDNVIIESYYAVFPCSVAEILHKIAIKVIMDFFRIFFGYIRGLQLILWAWFSNQKILFVLFSLENGVPVLPV